MLKSNALSLTPRHLRPAINPLGLYFRAARADKQALLDLLARGDANCFGFVVEAKLVASQRELCDRAMERRLDIILDPQTQPAATPGGYSNTLGQLPWGLGRQHTPTDFEGNSGNRLMTQLADFAVTQQVTQILSPSHVLTSVDDEWLGIDLENIDRLRKALDKASNQRIPIIGSLAIPYATLRDQAQLRVLVQRLKSAPIDSLWVKVDGLGSDATSNGLSKYIEASREFHDLRIPILADGMGGIAGLGLLANGGVGGLVHGVTFGERFSSSNWRRKPTGKAFSVHHRVYIKDLDLHLKPEIANQLLQYSTRTRTLGCRDSHCCPRGLVDMIENPARHFLVQRMKQIGMLGQIPENVRPSEFLEKFLRPTTDYIAMASDLDLPDAGLLKTLRNQRKRLDAMRVSLGKLGDVARRPSPPLPMTRVVRELRV